MPQTTQYGLSAGAIITRDNAVLLVRHNTSERDFWLPPGGRLEGDESIADCAARETREETGLSIQPERIVYIQELIEQGRHFVKFWFLCKELSGNLTTDNRTPAEDFLIDVKFTTRSEIENLQIIHPEIMRDLFWDDLAGNFPETRYLGLQKV